jgi:methionine biosynthesis protein MetW
LISEKGCRGCGIDIDLEEVRKCISRGVPVYHGDMLEGMAMFEDGRFDCVILSQTLQQTVRPDRVAREMLRVGRRAIISFPNFGHWQVRLQLLLGGRMPVTRVLPHRWDDTPNIHLLTIKDFLDLCREQKLHVVDRLYLTPTYRRMPGLLANLLASMAIFVIEAGRDG